MYRILSAIVLFELSDEYDLVVINGTDGVDDIVSFAVVKQATGGTEFSSENVTRRLVIYDDPRVLDKIEPFASRLNFSPGGLAKALRASDMMV